MHTFNAILLAALITASPAILVHADTRVGDTPSVRSMAPEAPRHPRRSARAPAPAPVSVRRPEAFIRGVNRIELPPRAAGRAQHRGNAVGSVRELMFDMGRTLRPDALMMTDSTPVWTLAVQSPGAKALRLHFVEVDVEGSFIVYAPHGDGVVVRYE